MVQLKVDNFAGINFKTCRANGNQTRGRGTLPGCYVHNKYRAQ